MANNDKYTKVDNKLKAAITILIIMSAFAYNVNQLAAIITWLAIAAVTISVVVLLCTPSEVVKAAARQQSINYKTKAIFVAADILWCIGMAYAGILIGPIIVLLHNIIVYTRMRKGLT